MADSTFTYTTSEGKKPGTLIVRLTGPLTYSTMLSFQSEFRSLRPAVLILDLSGTSYMDSAGLGLIMNAHVAAEAGKRKFLVAGTNGRVQSLMELTKVTRVLPMFPSVEAAEAAS